MSEPDNTPASIEARAREAAAPMLLALQQQGKAARGKSRGQSDAAAPGMGDDEAPRPGMGEDPAGRPGMGETMPPKSPGDGIKGTGLDTTLSKGTIRPGIGNTAAGIMTDWKTQLGNIDRVVFWKRDLNFDPAENPAYKQINGFTETLHQLAAKPRKPGENLNLPGEATFIANMNATQFPPDGGLPIIPIQALFEVANAHFDLGERDKGLAYINFAMKEANALRNAYPAEEANLTKNIGAFRSAVIKYYTDQGMRSEAPSANITGGGAVMAGRANGNPRQARVNPGMGDQGMQNMPGNNAPAEPAAPPPAIAVESKPENPRNGLYDRLKAVAEIYDQTTTLPKNRRQPVTPSQRYNEVFAAKGYDKNPALQDAAPILTLLDMAKMAKSDTSVRMPMADTLSAIQNFDNIGQPEKALPLITALFSQIERETASTATRAAKGQLPVAKQYEMALTGKSTAEVPDQSLAEVKTRLSELKMSLVMNGKSKGTSAVEQGPGGIPAGTGVARER